MANNSGVRHENRTKGGSNGGLVAFYLAAAMNL
jgi:hypothetical protein